MSGRFDSLVLVIDSLIFCVCNPDALILNETCAVEPTCTDLLECTHRTLHGRSRECIWQLSDDCNDLTTQASAAQHKNIYILETEHGSGAWWRASC